jgi:hypothetical protein
MAVLIERGWARLGSWLKWHYFNQSLVSLCGEEGLISGSDGFERAGRDSIHIGEPPRPQAECKKCWKLLRKMERNSPHKVNKNM